MEEDTLTQVVTAADTTQLSADSLVESVDTLAFEPTWDALRASIDTTAIYGDEASICDSLVPLQTGLQEFYTYGLPLHYGFMRSPWTVAVLLLAFVLLVSLFAWFRKYLVKQLKAFFVPSNNCQEQKAIKTPAERYAPFLLAVTECLMCGVLLFFFVSQLYDLDLGFLPHPFVLAACITVFVEYNLLRWVLYLFVNWIFFLRSHRKRWNGGFSLLSTVESLLLFPILVVVLHFSYTFMQMQIMLLVVYGVLRFLLLWHSYRIFFPKMYGILHLFVYLCTLELIPLFAMFAFMEVLSNVLIVK